jgi:hypothetical protein
MTPAACGGGNVIIYNLGPPWTAPEGLVYTRFGSACNPAGVSGYPSYVFYQQGGEIPASNFVSGTPTTL